MQNPVNKFCLMGQVLLRTEKQSSKNVNIILCSLITSHAVSLRRSKQLQHKAVVNDLTALEYIDEVAHF